MKPDMSHFRVTFYILQQNHTEVIHTDAMRKFRGKKWHWFMLFTADFPGALYGQRRDITKDDSKDDH